MTVFDEQGRKVSRAHDFTSIKIRTGSAVDRPAQEPAVAVMLLKRKDEDEDPKARKRTLKAGSTELSLEGRELDVEAIKNMGSPALTSSEQGHTHLVDLDERSGFTTWELMPGGELGHSHPYVVDAEGTLTVGEAEGHTHGLSVEARKGADGSAGEPTMTPEEQAQLDAEKKRADEAVAELETQKRLAGMTDAEKEHRKTLTGDALKAFDEGTAEVRLEAVKRAEAEKKSSKVVAYKATDGRVFFEGEDPRLIAETQRGDRLEAEAKKSRETIELTALKARAAELKHLPGTENSKVAMLKAIDAIPDETERKEALAALKASEAHASGAFQPHGAKGAESGTESGNGEAADRFEAGVKKFAETHKLTMSKARLAFFDTDEGRKLYREHAAATQPAGVN